MIKTEREYRCLGQWEENGLVYTYTKRQDVGTYECFVGGILSDNKLYIKEAGEHCQRHVNPFRYGMELNKVGKIALNQINLLTSYKFVELFNTNSILQSHAYTASNSARNVPT